MQRCRQTVVLSVLTGPVVGTAETWLVMVCGLPRRLVAAMTSQAGAMIVEQRSRHRKREVPRQSDPCCQAPISRHDC